MDSIVSTKAFCLATTNLQRSDGSIVLTIALDLALTIVQPQSCLIMAWYVLQAKIQLWRQRHRIANKLQNPHLLKIHFYTLRHWKAAMLYHQTKDILYVMKFLRHKNIKNTLIYIDLEMVCFQKTNLLRPALKNTTSSRASTSIANANKSKMLIISPKIKSKGFVLCVNS